MAPIRGALRQTPSQYPTAMVKSQGYALTSQWPDPSHNSSMTRPYNVYTTQPYIPPGYIQLHHPSSHYSYPHHQANSVPSSPLGSRDVASPPYSNGPVSMYTVQYNGYSVGDEYQRISPSQQYPYTKQVTHHLRHLSDSSSCDLSTTEDKIPNQTVRLKREDEF